MCCESKQEYTKMDKIEVILKSAYGMLLQDGPSLGNIRGMNNKCVYRASNGRKCAAGHLINDEFYSQDLEDMTINDGSVAIALINSGIPPLQLPIVNKLQDIHDGFLRIRQNKSWKKYIYDKITNLIKEEYKYRDQYHIDELDRFIEENNIIFEAKLGE